MYICVLGETGVSFWARACADMSGTYQSVFNCCCVQKRAGCDVGVCVSLRKEHFTNMFLEKKQSTCICICEVCDHRSVCVFFFCLSHRFATMTTAFIMTSLPLSESYRAGWCNNMLFTVLCVRERQRQKMQHCMIRNMRDHISHHAFE